MSSTFQRNVSPVERLFTIFSETDPPFCNQLILEGTGVIDKPLWEKAIAEACEANPSSRVVYQGRSVWAKWVDTGVPAPLRFVDGSNWSGFNSDGALFFNDPLPFKTSHSAEVVVVNGCDSPQRVILRTLHATMDGGGTWNWAHDIFRALRKEPLEGWLDPINDQEFLKSLKLQPAKPEKKIKCLTATGQPDKTQETGFIWNRVRLEGKFSKLLSQLTIAVAKEARKQGPGNVRIGVPLELRRRIPDTRSSSNLTRRIYLDVEPDDTIESITKQLIAKLENLNDDPKGSNTFGYIPSFWLKSLYLSSLKRGRETGNYKDSGTISNGGLLPLDELHGGGFVTESFFWIPTVIETKPFFMSTVGYGNILEVVTAMPKIHGSNGRLDTFSSNIIAELKSK